jgi:hypothetical protein
MVAIITPLWERMMQNLKAIPPGSRELPSFEFDPDEINAELAALPRWARRKALATWLAPSQDRSATMPQPWRN